MNKLEKHLLSLINEENNEKKDFPEEHSLESDMFWSVDVYNLENMTENTLLRKEYSQNEIYTTLLKLKQDGYLATGYNERFLITEKGKKELLSWYLKSCKFLVKQWIAIIALIISILTFFLK